MLVEEEPLRIGKIKKKVERTLGFSFPGDRSLLVSQTYLDELARRKPDAYLAYIEEASSIVSDPDFVSFEIEKETLTYYRTYFDKDFVAVGVTFIPMGVPKQWNLVSLKKNPFVEGEVKRVKEIKPKKD